MSRIALLAVAVPTLIGTLACSQVEGPPSLRDADDSPPQTTTTTTTGATDAPGVIVDYWLVAARPAEKHRIADDVATIAPAVLHELGDAPMELELFEHATLLTRADRVSRVEGARAKISDGPGIVEVELSGGAGKLEVPIDVGAGRRVQVLGRALVWPPFGAPFAHAEGSPRTSPVTVVVLARARATS